MANLGKVMYLTQAQYNTLQANGTLTVDNVTYTYNENDLYLVPSEDITVDTAVTQGSNNPVSSDAVYNAIQALSDSAADPLWYEIPLPQLKLQSGSYVVDSTLTELKMYLPKNQTAKLGDTVGVMGVFIYRDPDIGWTYYYPAAISGNSKIYSPCGMYGTVYLKRKGSSDSSFTDALSTDAVGIAVDASDERYFDPGVYLEGEYRYGVYIDYSEF